MASVFTFDPSPPRLASPWPSQPVSDSGHRLSGPLAALIGEETPQIASVAECGISKLQAEPQDGPTEYKLHLLLRPRRGFSASSTVQHVSGSQQSKSRSLQVGSTAEPRQARVVPGPIPSCQSRQNRLQHLTTQLLWRLQQSSPYHSSSKADLIVPVLSQAEVRPHTPGPNELLPGLEESQGALYEIGVSDDGTFVGLTEDELEESVMTLRAMAFSLGCEVKLLRVVLVGNCQWAEEPQQANAVKIHTETQQANAVKLHTENLWVAEALVSPNHGFREPKNVTRSLESTSTALNGFASEQSESETEQLRISLTGSSTSGKSSLLGTLSTSTLDNGRGKSRLSLLRHRHEIVSGISSSVTPELIGYHDISMNHENTVSATNVVNYASGNVSSWNDIHSASEPGRLVFFTDSAGHQRYYRTIVRGLVSWAPHWTVCCVATDTDGGGVSGAGAMSLRETRTNVDLSKSHLMLCLKLNLPLVVVITKLDVASSNGLRQILIILLTMLKFAGRKPAVFPAAGINPHTQDVQLQAISKTDENEALEFVASLKKSEIGFVVPIVLTSVVTGTGIGKLHALFRHLPVPRPSEYKFDAGAGTVGPAILFHIDEVFTFSDSPSQPGAMRAKSTQGMVLSGHLRHGSMMIGDELFIGPSIWDIDGSERRELHRTQSFPGQGNGNPSKLVKTHESDRPTSSDFGDRTHVNPVWKKIRITSLRNLRLPVRKLLAGQVGTAGITFDCSQTGHHHSLIAKCRIRKGMVLIQDPSHSQGQTPPSYFGCAAVFNENQVQSMFPGHPVIVYIASIRALAKILSISPHGEPNLEYLFINRSRDDGMVEHGRGMQEQEVKFEFVNSREWIELGTPILVTPAGGPGAGRSEGGDNVRVDLDGVVGKISQALE